MKIEEIYSHNRAEELLIVRHQALWDEVQQVIRGIDASQLRTKVSRERTRRGRNLYSPVEMNKAFKAAFNALGWQDWRYQFWATRDHEVAGEIYAAQADEQKSAIEHAGHVPIMSYNQTDFVKDRIAVEVQFGKYAFVAHDIFVKHQTFFVAKIIDAAIEILPMKEMEMQMSSGVPYYERDLMNLMRHGRGSPSVPLMLIGISP